MTAAAVESRVLTAPAGKDAVASAVPPRAARDLVNGTFALGLAVLIERGFGFLANLLAARIGGASTFGAYSLAITTANNVSTYAAGGIGSTAIRFSGRYVRESSGYRTLAKVLLIISVVSAILGGAVLCLGAEPLARLLGKPSLGLLLRWTALSAGGMVLLECCRGFLVGQRRVPAILLLSLTVGIGMITLLPFTSKFGPVAMIVSQGTVAAAAVAGCVLFARPLGLTPTRKTESGAEPLGPMLRSVWSFGMVQLAGLIALNAAGWWLTSLIAHADTSMAQMGFFAIASQLRNIVSVAPSLLTESSLAVMAQGEGDVEATPDRVMAVCTFVTMSASLLLAGIGMAAMPWALPLLYGKAYAAAAAAATIALATAVIHMGSGPASARLSILSIRQTGVINTVWALFVAGAAALFLLEGGNAWKAALIYFGAHVLSAVMLLTGLARRCSLPSGVREIYALGGGGAGVLLGLAVWRGAHPELSLVLTAGMLAVLMAALLWLTELGRRKGWLPSLSALRELLVRKRLWPARLLEAPNTGGFDA